MQATIQMSCDTRENMAQPPPPGLLGWSWDLALNSGSSVKKRMAGVDDKSLWIILYTPVTVKCAPSPQPLPLKLIFSMLWMGWPSHLSNTHSKPYSHHWEFSGTWWPYIAKWPRSTPSKMELPRQDCPIQATSGKCHIASFWVAMVRTLGKVKSICGQTPSSEVFIWLRMSVNSLETWFASPHSKKNWILKFVQHWFHRVSYQVFRIPSPACSEEHSLT